MNFTAAPFASSDLVARAARLVRRTQQLPPPGARPVVIEGRVAGWVADAAQHALAGLPGIRVQAEALYIAPARHRDSSLNRVLRNAAFALRDADCIRAWRGEALDVVAEGRVLGRMERGALRPLGLLTQAVHLNAWSGDGRLWVACRSLDKSTDPGLWDTLAGGLVSAGESPATALLRESHEEAGLAAAELSGHGPLRMLQRLHRRLPEGYQVENVLLSDCVLGESALPHNLDGEVQAFRLVDMRELWDMILRDAFTVEAELAILDSLQRWLQNVTQA